MFKEKTVKKTEKFSVNKLSIDVNLFDIKITSKDVKEVSIIFHEDIIKLNVKKDVLYIKEDERDEVRNNNVIQIGFININKKSNIRGSEEIEIVVPKHMDSISISCSSGDIDMSNVIVDSLHIDSMNGDIDCQYIDTEECQIDNACGDIDLSLVGDISSCRMNFDISSGGVKVGTSTTTSKKRSKYKNKKLSIASDCGDVDVYFI